MADAGVALDIVCYVFAGLYGALFVWSVIRLLLLQRAYTQWTQQKLFHLISCGIGGGASPPPRFAAALSSPPLERLRSFAAYKLAAAAAACCS